MTLPLQEQPTPDSDMSGAWVATTKAHHNQTELQKLLVSLTEKVIKIRLEIKPSVGIGLLADEITATHDRITQLIVEAERTAKISETQYWFDLALTEDADAVLMNSLRRQFRNRLAQLQGEEQ